MNRTSTLWAVLGSIAVVLVFRIIGWIDNSWFGLGMVGAVFGVVLLQKIPETKLTVFTKIYLAWIIWVAILPMIQNGLAGSAPITAQAMSDRRVYEDLRGGELTRPQMLNALLGYGRAINGIDDSVGLKIAAKCADLQARGSSMSLSDLQNKTQQIGQEIEEYKNWRREAGKPILEFPKPVNPLQGTPPRRMFWSIGLLLAIAGVLLPATYPKASRAIWGLAVAFAILFVFDMVIWGGIVSLSDVQNASAKTLYFAVGICVITIIALGHIFKRGALGWVIGILIVMLLIGYQSIWGGGTSSIGNKLSSHSNLTFNYPPIVKDVTPGDWTQVDLPPRPFQWESTVDIRFKFSDGRVLDAPKNEWTKLGKIPGTNGTKRVWVQATSSPGQVFFTIN